MSVLFVETMLGVEKFKGTFLGYLFVYLWYSHTKFVLNG